MEFGYVLKNYGVDVTIVEFLDRALPNEDADVSKEIAKQYKKLGVTIKTCAAVQTHRRRRQSRSPSSIKNNKSGDIETVVVDKVLHVGRIRAPRRGLRPREDRRAAHRSRRDRASTTHAHQRAAHLRHR